MFKNFGIYRTKKGFCWQRTSEAGELTTGKGESVADCLQAVGVAPASEVQADPAATVQLCAELAAANRKIAMLEARIAAQAPASPVPPAMADSGPNAVVLPLRKPATPPQAPVACDDGNPVGAYLASLANPATPATASEVANG